MTALTVKLLSVADAARAYAVHRNTIYRWCRGRLVPHERIGRTLRVAAPAVGQPAHSDGGERR